MRVPERRMFSTLEEYSCAIDNFFNQTQNEDRIITYRRALGELLQDKLKMKFQHFPEDMHIVKDIEEITKRMLLKNERIIENRLWIEKIISQKSNTEIVTINENDFNKRIAELQAAEQT